MKEWGERTLQSKTLCTQFINKILLTSLLFKIFVDDKQHQCTFQIFKVAQLLPEELLYHMGISVCLTKSLYTRFPLFLPSSSVMLHQSARIMLEMKAFKHFTLLFSLLVIQMKSGIFQGQPSVSFQQFAKSCTYSNFLYILTLRELYKASQ
jgi:hypothetical protein